MISSLTRGNMVKNTFLVCVLAFLVQGAPDDRRVSVSVMEGDSVTLHTNTINPQQDGIRWYYNDTRIAQINRDQSKICTDDQCKERFRGRLKLDHQTGSLTIMNTRTEDSGEYRQSMKIKSDTYFNVYVHGVPAAEREVTRKSVKEGESVTLDPGVIKSNDVMKWYFKDIPIAEITEDQSKICTDVQCEERFRDRLKLDHQTGSLTITNIRNTDSGEYTLKINNRFSIFRSFSVAVTGSGLSSGVGAGISVAVVLELAAFAALAALICYRRRSSKK